MRPRGKENPVKDLSIKDIIGPVMIGPSSSHTAGALRIALMARRLLQAEPVSVSFRLYGSFAHTYSGHGTDRALLGGILGMAPDDERIRDSFSIARESGLEFEFSPCPDEPCDHPNTVDLDITDASGEHTSLRGESIGGGAAVISRINGVDVRLTGEYHSIVVRQRDRQGVLAHIATCLNIYGINIATTRLFRERKGDIAYTIMETDDRIPADIVRAMAKNPDIQSVRIIESDHCEDAGTAGRDPGEQTDPAAAQEAFENADFADAEELLALCAQDGLPISAVMLRRESALSARNNTADDAENYLAGALSVMRESAHASIAHPTPSMGGLLGGEAAKLSACEASAPARGELARAVTYAMAVLETNASMGRIVAAPTAGSAGVVPAMLLTCEDFHGFDDGALIRALANAAAVGYLITRNATVSGAEGGCQAEVGAASAMAASAATELFGGTPEQCLAAASNALSGLMGLVCDPIAGLVEAPCQKRNATGAANAFAAAQIALAGIGNLVDFDQTVAAMFAVGRSLPFELRESALGGLAATPAACAFCSGCGR